METDNIEKTFVKRRNFKDKFSLRNLRISLKYRPEIMKLVLKMRQCIRKKSRQIKKLKEQLKNKESSGTETSERAVVVDPKTENKSQFKDSFTQTNHDDITREVATTDSTSIVNSDPKNPDSGWNIEEKVEGKSIADQVKEAAQSAIQQSGMVYVESAGMYYDYKTGYYYNSELGLYYHTDTGCYYYYSEEKKEFVFHSYPDRSAAKANMNPSLEAHEKRKARKQKKAQKAEEDIDNITKNLSQEEEEDEPRKPKRKKVKQQKEKGKKEIKAIEKDETKSESKSMETDDVSKEKTKETVTEEKNSGELEDGECSETNSDENSDSESEDDVASVASTVSLIDDDAVAKHHPPCMRIIVKETKLPKLKIGSLFLITKDGGSVGREGENHTILLRDNNVSRNHLDLKYCMSKRTYLVTDLGSKNGTLLNGIQMSESQIASLPMEVVHGSTIQLGETKLLCHIHPGNDTCGHCEPGLIMETQEKEKAAYTRTCNVKKQYELELARLKNKYKPEPLMIEDGSYNDRAKARRETVGSSHHSEKTQSADTETHIAPENKGFKLLEKMGWSKGEGLGKDNQGDTAPIPLVSNEGKVGLGTPGAVAAPNPIPLPKIRNTIGPATLRLATRSKLLQPPAKAFQPDDDDEESEPQK